MATNSKYMEEIANQQLLTDAEERELAAKIKIGDAKALEKLTKANLKFVVSLAHQSSMVQKVHDSSSLLLPTYARPWKKP